MPDLASLEINGAVATLTLQRPESRNALSLDLLMDLRSKIAEVATQVHSAKAANPVVVMILTGAGKSFCAGMDLKQVLNQPGAPLRLLSAIAEATLELRSLGCVTIAAVNGAAIGGGCGLAVACDLAVTHGDSKMGFPEVDLGVCPAVVAPWLVRKIGHGRARRILLSGGLISGQDASGQGIVDHMVPTLAELDAAADTIAARLATGGPGAIRATKKLLNELDHSLDEELGRRAAALSAEVLGTPEARAMLQAKLKL